MDQRKLDNLADAIAFAAAAHVDQTDRHAEPYILHPLTVMQSLMSVHGKKVGVYALMAAVLHDVVEDTNWTLEELLSIGCPQPVVNILDCLTHRPGEEYSAYILRVSKNPFATTIKVKDLEHNMSLDRMLYRETHDEKDMDRLFKYMRAWMFLKNRISEEFYLSNWSLSCVHKPLP
jgi:(p)ppGpp synthase/HD superfamily hydrolase